MSEANNKELKDKELNIEYQKIIKKYGSTRIPIIIEKSDIQLSHYKFLIPPTLQMGNFLNSLRNKFKLSSTEALYLFTRNNHILLLSLSAKEAYNEFAGNDFLYLTLKKETTFGAL